MLRFTIVFLFVLGLTASGYSQKDQKEDHRSINKEWKEAMQEVEEALQDIEIPDVDIDRIMEEVRDAMPTREEMDSYREIVSDAVREVKNIDFSELEEALNDLGRELENIFQDRHYDKSKSKSKDDKMKKIN